MNGQINGKTMDQILRELSDPIPKEELKYSEDKRVTYIPTEVVRRRLDKVLGGNYSEIYDDCQVMELPASKTESTPYIRLRCTITIIDDAGNEVCKRSCYTARSIIRVNSSGNCKDPANDFDSACADAFKRCAKRFGVDSPLVGTGNNIRTETGGSGRQTAAPKQTLDQDQIYEIQFTGEFSTLGKTGYSAPVIVGELQYELIIWNKYAEEFGSKFKGIDWRMAAMSGKVGKIRAKESVYSGKRQLEFSGYAG